MNEQITPAPWFVDLSGQVHNGKATIFVSGGDKQSPQLVCTVGPSPQSAIADAFLIAAAPDLLRRLCDLVEGLEGVQLPGAMPARLEKARKAISDACYSENGVFIK